MASNSKPRKRPDPEKSPGRAAAAEPPKPEDHVPANGTTPLRRRPVVGMSAKGRSTVELFDFQAHKGREMGRNLDTAFSALGSAMQKKFGALTVALGSDFETIFLGFPMPAVVFEYLLMLDGFPLGTVMHLAGEPKCGKSGLVAEFCRWFYCCQGGYSINSNEDKFAAPWYRSIMGEGAFNRLRKSGLIHCKSLEDWQDGVTAAVRFEKQIMTGTKKNPGPGRTFPFMIAVDSIMGKLSSKSQEKILGALGLDGSRGITGAGHADRAFPLEALLITRYLKTIPQELANWPFTLVLVNHTKWRTNDQTGITESSTTGGQTINFQESFELEVTRSKNIACAEFEGFVVDIKCKENSYGPDGRKIRTRVLWWDERGADGEWHQRTIWDWDWSLVWLLNDLLNGERVNAYTKACLKDSGFHLEVTKQGDIENGAWSRDLGMKGPDDAVPWNELGAMLRQNQTTLDSIRQALRIKRLPWMKGDYLDQLNKLARDTAAGE
jgi:hypothetical protein